MHGPEAQLAEAQRRSHAGAPVRGGLEPVEAEAERERPRSCGEVERIDARVPRRVEAVVEEVGLEAADVAETGGVAAQRSAVVLQRERLPRGHGALGGDLRRCGKSAQPDNH